MSHNQFSTYLVRCSILFVLILIGCDDKSVSDESMDTGAPLADSGVGARDAGPSVEDASAIVDGVVFGDAQALPPRGDCDDSSPPVVMAHGFLASSDTWAAHVQRFVANGRCADRYHAFDWNTLDRNADHTVTLDTFIDEILALHDADKVDLFGHSAGGGLGYSYLENPDRAAKVRRYVHVGSFPAEGPAGSQDMPVPTLNLWSTGDLAVMGEDIVGATNVQLSGEDHYAAATSESSFAAIYEFLHDEAPSELSAKTEDRPIVQGRMVTLGENQVEDGGRVEVWSLTAGEPRRAQAVRSFAIGPDGYWGPFVADPTLRYEFLGVPTDSAAPAVRYFREEFTADQPLMYLRTLPGPGSIAGVLLSLLPLDGETVPLVIYNARGAFLVGRDSLTLDGQELLTEQSAPAENTSIALFVFDVDNDGESGGTSALFDMFPFLAAIDLPISATPDGSMSLVYNGRTLSLPKDGPENGVIIAVFD